MNTAASHTSTVGILGLGLIGGSFARAYKSAGWDVLAFDTDEEMFEAACIETVAGTLDEESIGSCDLIVLAAYPAACEAWLHAHAHILGEMSSQLRTISPVVIDTAGVKKHLCEVAFPLAKRFHFAFCGAHPMAGTQFSGFAHARADLFHDSPMVLVPPDFLSDSERLELLDRVHTLLAPCRFGNFSVTSADAHDRIIAFTSQLCHVVSNAYVKSPTAQAHAGFSAGSYRDLTRVAHLNPAMWAELMMADRVYLSRELEQLIDALSAYRNALERNDRDELERLLAEGDVIKRKLDDRREEK